MIRLLTLLVLLLELVSLIILVKETYHDRQNNRKTIKKNIKILSIIVRKAQYYFQRKR